MITMHGYNNKNTQKTKDPYFFNFNEKDILKKNLKFVRKYLDKRIR